MSGNGINERQNSPLCLKMLAAQRQLYRECKWYNFFSLVMCVIVPFICAVVLLFLPKNSVFETFTYVVSLSGMLISVYSKKKMESKQAQAAKTQLLFDTTVFQLPWDEKLFGSNNNTNPLIAEKSIKIISKDTDYKKLINWYPEKYDKLSLNEAIPLCQQANIAWDSNIRTLYRVFLAVIIIVMVLSVIALGIASNETINLLLWRLAFVVPLVKWLIEKINSVSNDFSRLNEFRGIFLFNRKYSDDDLLLIQSKIQHHREKCTLIPDWFYTMLRNRQENIMGITADLESKNR